MRHVSVVVLAVLLMTACDDGEGPDTVPVASFEIIAPGEGDPNTAQLWPMRVGSMWGDNVVEGITRRDGLALLRYVQPPIPDPIIPRERNPPVVSWFSFTEVGLAFHGSTRQGFYEVPLLLVPAEVRLGMIWESEADGVRVRFEVTARADEPTPLFGTQTVWTIVQTAVATGDQVAEWRWIEGLGPDDDEIRRVFLPEMDQPGIDIDYEVGTPGERIPMGEDDAVQGPTDSFQHISSHTLDSRGRGALTAHPAFSDWGACFSSDGTSLFPGAFGPPTEALDYESCPGLDPESTGRFSISGHVGAAVPLGGRVHFELAARMGVTDRLVFGTSAFVHFATYLDLMDRPVTLRQVESETSTFARRHRPLRTVTSGGAPSDELLLAARWVAVDQVNHYALATSGPRNVILHGYRPRVAPVPMTLRSTSGALLTSSLGPDGIGPIELAFHKAGDVHYAMHPDRREILTTTPDGLVHRVEPTADGGLALVRLAQIVLPDEESMVGAFWASDPNAGLDSPLLVLGAVNDYVCATGAGCSRPHHLYRVLAESSGGTEDTPPPSTGVSVVRDGWDALVCWPRALGAPSMASGWRLGGQAPAAVVEEPDGVGSCVLLIRDLTTPPSFAPGAFHVEGTIPGVGPMHMAAAVTDEDGRSVPDLDSFSDVLELPGLDTSYPPSPYAPTGGFISMSTIFGVSGVPISQPDNLGAIEGGVSVVGAPDVASTGLWASWANLLNRYVTFSAGPGAPTFTVEPDTREVQSERPGYLVCVDEGSTAQRCTRLLSDGSTEDAGDLSRSAGLRADLELADGTVCGVPNTGTPAYLCLDPDGTRHELDSTAIPSSTVRLPIGRGWFGMTAGSQGMHYVDLATNTVTDIDTRCPAAPSRDLDGDWWVIFRDDGMGGCFGPERDQTIVPARLRPGGAEDVTGFPQPADVFDEDHWLAGVVVSREVVLVMTRGSSRSAGGGGPGSRAMDVYRLPRSAFP